VTSRQLLAARIDADVADVCAIARRSPVTLPERARTLVRRLRRGEELAEREEKSNISVGLS